MKRENKRVQSPFIGHLLWKSRIAPQVTLGMLALVVGLVSVGTSPCTAAIPVLALSAVPSNPAVYLYDSNNNAVLVADAVISEGGVYTESGFVGTIDSSGQIVGVNNTIVGYTVSSD